MKTTLELTHEQAHMALCAVEARANLWRGYANIAPADLDSATLAQKYRDMAENIALQLKLEPAAV